MVNEEPLGVPTAEEEEVVAQRGVGREAGREVATVGTSAACSAAAKEAVVEGVGDMEAGVKAVARKGAPPAREADAAAAAGQAAAAKAYSQPDGMRCSHT